VSNGELTVICHAERLEARYYGVVGAPQCVAAVCRIEAKAGSGQTQSRGSPDRVTSMLS
jgi:hypothetical protein